VAVFKVCFCMSNMCNAATCHQTSAVFVVALLLYAVVAARRS
jgi:hypothetical protein